MFCTSFHQPLPASSFVSNLQADKIRRNQVFLFSSSSSSPSSLGKHQWKISNNPKLGFRLKPNVLPPSESGDITTFLFVSGVMISMYLVANFLVPSMLFKSLEDDEEEDS